MTIRDIIFCPGMLTCRLMHRRALLLYVVAIVLPVCILLWLGVQSFERQRQALSALTAEKITTAVETRVRDAARSALSGEKQPVVQFRFRIEDGIVVDPPLYSPPPHSSPPEFAEAERQELSLNRPDAALELYRRLAGSPRTKALALSRVARCLEKIGRAGEAKAVWRQLAREHPDDRDLAHRPFGIVAAIQSGDTAGLAQRIISGRWRLPADQAEYFLGKLNAPLPAIYAFARELSDQFRHQGVLETGEMYSYSFGAQRVYYSGDGAGRIHGISVNQNWIRETLTPEIRLGLGLTLPVVDETAVYGGAIAVVLTILTAGVFLLLRDLSRDARTNRIRSDFVSSVSHELKTPITVIRLYSETLERGIFEDSVRRDFYRIITRESERLGRLVDQVLTFSRLERGDAVFTLENADPVQVIAQVLDDYRDYVDRVGFRLQHSLPDSAPSVRIDSAAVSQALINLLDNAIKYSVESREVAVRLHAADGSVIVEVEDHGVGIPKEEQAKIFERFYRVQNSTGKGGYGIGLFMVRHIMQAHGGRAEVESVPGHGSRFRLVFPTANA